MTIGLWHTLTYTDADAGLAWMKAIGFTEKEVHRDPEDPTVIVHAELLWPTVIRSSWPSPLKSAAASCR